MNEILINLAETFGPSVLIIAIASLALWRVFGSFVKNQGTQISNLINDNRGIRAELKQRKDEIHEERELSNKYRQQLESLSNHVDTLQKSLTEQRDQVTKLVKGMGSLSKQVIEIKREHASAMKRIEDLATSIADFTHYLEQSKSIDPTIVEKFENTLNDHGQELFRLKTIVERLHPSSAAVHEAVVSVFDNEHKAVSAEELEMVLKTMVPDEGDKS